MSSFAPSAPLRSAPVALTHKIGLPSLRSAYRYLLILILLRFCILEPKILICILESILICILESILICILESILICILESILICILESILICILESILICILESWTCLVFSIFGAILIYFLESIQSQNSEPMCAKSNQSVL
jgi:hypothetical protein